MVRRLTILACVAVLAGGVAGCGDHEGATSSTSASRADDAGLGVRASRSTSASRTDDAGLGVRAPGAQPTKERLSREELEGNGLELQDMPSGWKRDTESEQRHSLARARKSSPPTTSAGTSGCAALDAARKNLREDDYSSQREFVLAGGTRGKVTVQAAQYSDTKAAEDEMSYLRTLIKCGRLEGSDGSTTVSEVSTSKLGDDSTAGEFTMTSGATSISYTTRAARVGSLLVMVASLGSVPAETAEDTLRKQVAKVEKALGRR